MKSIKIPHITVPMKNRMKTIARNKWKNLDI